MKHLVLMAIVLCLCVATPMPSSGQSAVAVSKPSAALYSLNKQGAYSSIVSDPPAYGYSPLSTLALGRGFVPSDITLPKFPCISFKEHKLDPGPPLTQLSLSYVSTQNELEDSLGLELKLKNATLVSSVGGGFKLDFSHIFHENALTVVMRASTDFGRWGLESEPVLTPSALAIVSDGERFERQCGSRYVSIERRGAFIAAILTATGVSEEDKHTFTAELNAGTGGKIGPSAEAKLSHIIRVAAKQDRLSVEVLASGGGGLGSLGDLVAKAAKSEKNIAEISEGLGESLKAFTEANAAAMGYVVSSMSDFDWNEAALDPWTDLHEERLGNIAREYRAAQADIKAAESIIAGTDKRSSFITATERDYIKKMKADLSAQLTTLARAHEECKKATIKELDQGCPVVTPHKKFLPPFPEPMGVKYATTLTFAKPDPATGNTWKVLDDATTRVLLDNKPKYRLSVAKTFYRDTIAVGITQGFQGDLLLSGRAVFHELDGSGTVIDTWDMTTEEALRGRSRTWFGDSGSGPESGYAEDDLQKQICEYRGKHKGVIRFYMRDKDNSISAIDAFDVSWEANSTGCRIEQFDSIY